MGHKSMKSCIAYALVVALLSAGCSMIPEALADNRLRAAQLQLGMSKEDVTRVMGSGLIYEYRKFQLTNPWRTDSFQSKDGAPVEITYYLLEERNRNYYFASDDELMPVVLENGKVVGLGWPFIQQNVQRYEYRYR